MFSAFRPLDRGLGFLAPCVVLVGFCLGCNKSGPGAESATQAGARRSTEIVHEECDIASSSAERLDANGDGRADITIVRDNGREVCRAVDLNFDGVIDTWSYFDQAGQLRRREFDFDRDGRIDEIAIFRAGIPVEKHRSASGLGKLDTWDFYENGVLARTERDSDGDGRVDQWWEYGRDGCPMMHSDANRDGRPDVGTTIDYCKETGYTPPARQDYRQPTSPDFQRRDSLPTETESKEVPSGAEQAGGEKP